MFYLMNVHSSDMMEGDVGDVSTPPFAIEYLTFEITNAVLAALEVCPFPMNATVKPIGDLKRGCSK